MEPYLDPPQWTDFTPDTAMRNLGMHCSPAINLIGIFRRRIKVGLDIHTSSPRFALIVRPVRWGIPRHMDSVGGTDGTLRLTDAHKISRLISRLAALCTDSGDDLDDV